MDDLERTRMPDGEIRMMRQDRQSPSIGRVVLFSNGESANGAKEWVAIIGQVFEDPNNPRPYCNLLVFPPFGTPRWEGSVQEAIEVEDAPESEHTPRVWRWPPRV